MLLALLMLAGSIDGGADELRAFQAEVSNEGSRVGNSAIDSVHD